MAKLGIQHNGVFIGAMSLPDRKKPCLVVECGNECVVIGTFNNADCVEFFEQALRQLFTKEE